MYRSRLLLDEDLAARSATLGRVYNEVGFTELGLQEGRQSVSLDPTNYSAHRLLADSYAALPGVEAARVSELLQAQLLQPINITPVQPQMAETRLLMPSAVTTFSLYEFAPLFVRNQPTLWASALGGNQSTWGDDLIVSGLTDRFSYSLGQFHYQSDGYRENNDLKNDIYNLFGQVAVTPELNLQAEYRHRDTTNGDLNSNFDNIFSKYRRRGLNQGMGRIGANYALSPQLNLIASAIYLDRTDEITSNSPTQYVKFEAINRNLQQEIQLRHKADDFNLITGLGTSSVNYSSYFFYRLGSEEGVQEGTATGDQSIGYGYANIRFPENLIWTIGFSDQLITDTSADLHEFNPKLGVQWAVNEQISLRAAAFQVVTNPANVTYQTIEPTQVAGFNQFFDDYAATVSKNYGAALDIKFSPRLFGGLGALRRDLEVPFGTLDTPDFYEIDQQQIDQYGAYLYWMPSQRWAVKAAGVYENFEVKEGLLPLLFTSPPLPSQLRTITLPLDIQYFDPSGFFAGLGMVYVNQRVQFADPQSFNPVDPSSSSLSFLPMQSESFTLLNAGLGYRLPKRWGLIALQGNNLTDRKFRYQDNSFRTTDNTVNPLYIPERTIFGRVIINF